MPIESVASFVAALKESGSLRPAQMEEVAGVLQGHFDQPRSLAKELLQRGWLTAFQINQVFQGRGRELTLGPYVLLERIGEGGMGQVFKAWHRHLDRMVALKVIRQDRLDSSDTVRRFQREIEIAAKLSHPNIVAAYDADEIAGTRFIALEYVEGIDLGKLVKQTGPLPVAQACDYIRQAALGLQHAFERGLVHRDIKPSNLLVTGGNRGTRDVEPGTVKILDMGLARMQGGGQAETLTQFQTTLGTPDFIAPEQARDARSADIRADLYSLGCTFYYLLAGKVPFPDTAPMEKLLKHWLEEPRRIEEMRPEVPPEIANIVRKLMAKKPEDRYQTPIELIAALASVTGAEAPAKAWPAVQPQDSGRETTPTPETFLPGAIADTEEGPIIHIEVPRPTPRRQWIQVVLCCVAVAVMGALIAMLVYFQ
jgi:serine/threonine-protein kinase